MRDYIFCRNCGKKLANMLIAQVHQNGNHIVEVNNAEIPFWLTGELISEKYEPHEEKKLEPK